MTQPITILEKSHVERCANILGPSSASAHALADYEERLARGEEPVFVQHGDALLVVNLKEAD